ncbi:MAG TPA: glycosyltransferase [bacterium]|nr:glycosyltransferase [bacterium]HPN81564.1 glycosyltransferase [bacterium]HPW39547.1 glycosyltransferase [bacterium]
MKLLIVLPIYNEQAILAANARAVYDYCRQNFSDFKIVIADNGSTDNSGTIGRNLAGRFPGIEYVFFKEKGKGNAWRQVFLATKADIYIFMDIDLSVTPKQVDRLVASILAGNNLALGSRFVTGAIVKRSVKRRLISWLYRLVAGLVLNLRVKDLQCGFKALDNQAKELLNFTKDDGFFLDTELIFWARKQGLKIEEIPVIWQENQSTPRKSKVKVVKTSCQYLKKIISLLFIDKK